MQETGMLKVDEVCLRGTGNAVSDDLYTDMDHHCL